MEEIKKTKNKTQNQQKPELICEAIVTLHLDWYYLNFFLKKTTQHTLYLFRHTGLMQLVDWLSNNTSRLQDIYF